MKKLALLALSLLVVSIAYAADTRIITAVDDVVVVQYKRTVDGVLKTINTQSYTAAQVQALDTRTVDQVAFVAEMKTKLGLE